MQTLNLRPAVFCTLGQEACNVLASIEAESNRPPWPESLFSSEFSNRCARIFGARIGGELVGFIICHAVEGEAHIVNFGLRAHLRGLGYGKGLLRHCLEELSLEHVHWVSLEVRRGNRVARNLYESEGFLEVCVRERYYSDNGEDALLLKLNLEHWRSVVNSAKLSSTFGPPRLTMNDS